MPAPDHLIPILDRLGDGGTVTMAETVWALIEEGRTGTTPTPAEAFEAGKTYIIRNLDSASPFMDDGDTDYPPELAEIAARVGCEFVVFDPSVQVAASDLAATDVTALAEALGGATRLASELAYLDVEPEGDEQPDQAALRAIRDARSWARHGYELGQRSCSWSDQGVAPAWLTEGWPTSFPGDLVPDGDTHQVQHDTYTDGKVPSTETRLAPIDCPSRDLHVDAGAVETGERRTIDGLAGTLILCPRCGSAVTLDPDQEQPAPAPDGYPVAAPEPAIDWDDNPEPAAGDAPAEPALTPSPATSAAGIRAWARDNDVDVPAKGAIPKAVREQYYAAHPEA